MGLSIAAAVLLDGTSALGLALVLDGAFALLVLVDRLRTADPVGLVVDRSFPARAGLSRPFVRELELEGPRAGLRVTVHEDFPDCCVVEERTLDGVPAPPDPVDPSGGADTLVTGEGGRGVVRRTYRSERRGRMSFGNVRVAILSPLGLVLRQTELAGEGAVVVESALADLDSTLALAASERWRDLGVRRIRRKGGQTEFESLRDYVRGDDVRLVDWKAFAKRGKPTVRQYQEERGQELVILFDCGRRMRATAPGRVAAGRRTPGPEADVVLWSKLDWALDAGLQLAAVALQQGDRVGCMVFDDRVRHWVAPSRGRRQFARLREAVHAVQPTRRDTDLARALRELGVRYRRTATVVLLSDVPDPRSVAVERRALTAGSRRHRLVFAALDDPELRDAAEAPELWAPAGETAIALRATAQDAIETRRRSLRALSSAGVRVLDALPAEAAGPLLTAWLEAKRGA